MSWMSQSKTSDAPKIAVATNATKLGHPVARYVWSDKVSFCNNKTCHMQLVHGVIYVIEVFVQVSSDVIKNSAPSILMRQTVYRIDRKVHVLPMAKIRIYLSTSTAPCMSYMTC